MQKCNIIVEIIEYVPNAVFKPLRSASFTFRAARLYDRMNA
jgi:hypothetical protein